MTLSKMTTILLLVDNIVEFVDNIVEFLDNIYDSDNGPTQSLQKDNIGNVDDNFVIL